MEVQLGQGKESVEAMKLAVSRLLEGIGAVKRLSRHIQSEDWTLVEACGEDLLKEALASLCASGLVLESMVSTFASQPLSKLLNGERLSEGEYHALRAVGAIPNIEQLFGISTEGEYGTYCRLYYDGGSPSRRGMLLPLHFIHRHRVCDPRTGMSLHPLDFGGVHLGNASRSRLDDYQAEFFHRHFPEDLEAMEP